MPDEIKVALQTIRSKIKEFEKEIARLKTAEDVLVGLGCPRTQDLFAESAGEKRKGLSDIVRDALKEYNEATTNQVVVYVLKRRPDAKRSSIRATLSGRKISGEFALNKEKGLWSLSQDNKKGVAS